MPVAAPSPTSQPQLTPYQLTVQDWLRLPEDGPRYELLRGELYVSPPPNIDHQRISRRLLFILQLHLGGELGEVLYAPVGVKLSETDVPEPDLLVVLAENSHRIGQQMVEGAPDLVVEILSPGTAGRDLVAKRALYEQHGVPEYWVVDPKGDCVEVLVLRQGRYASLGRFGRGERFESVVLTGLQVEVAEVLPT